MEQAEARRERIRRRRSQYETHGGKERAAEEFRPLVRRRAVCGIDDAQSEGKIVHADGAIESFVHGRGRDCTGRFCGIGLAVGHGLCPGGLRDGLVGIKVEDLWEGFGLLEEGLEVHVGVQNGRRNEDRVVG